MSSITDVKAEQDRLLQKTDYTIIRALDPTSGKEVPREVIIERKQIRAAAKAIAKLSVIPDDVAGEFERRIRRPEPK